MSLPIILVIVLLVSWFFHYLKSVWFNVYLWQLKEYHLDRMKAHFSTKTAWVIFYRPLSILKWLILILGWFLINQPVSFFLMVVTLIGVYVLEDLLLIKHWLEGKLRRPQRTGKAMLIVVYGLLLMLVWLYTLNFDIEIYHPLYANFFFVGIMDLILPALIAIAVLVLIPVTKLGKALIIQRAKAKLKQYPDLKIIGITGSFGKSSVKEFTATLLSEKYTVLKTPANINTAIGVAQIILKDLKSSHQIFIVEMGAHRPGEIKAICNLVHPSIGVLTMIGDQHLALFKTVDNIIKAKFELIESLPSSGLAILNADDVNSMKNKAKSQAEVKTFALEAKADYKPSKISEPTSILGEHNIKNILPALAIAEYLDLTPEQIKAGLKAIQPVPGRMEPIITKKNKALLINDTYNAGTASVKAALDYLQTTPGLKIWVFAGMIEQGSQAAAAHQALGKQAGIICDYVFITGKEHAAAIKAGLMESDFNMDHYFKITNYDRVAKKITKLLKSDSTILLSGRGPEQLIPGLDKS